MANRDAGLDGAAIRRIEALERKLERAQASLEIAALPARYARAADARDIEGLVALYVDDVDCGSFGRGHQALHTQFTSALQDFYRSVHFVCGHAVDDLTDDSASGTTYCLAMQELATGWISVAVRYEDHYARQAGSWRYVRRVPHIWYVAPAHDGRADPQELWPGVRFRRSIPDSLDTWKAFWGPQALADEMLRPPVAGSGA